MPDNAIANPVDESRNANGRREPATNPLVAALIDETGVPPTAMLQLEGYLGPVIAGRRRIYTGTAFTDAVEFPADAICFFGHYQLDDAVVPVDVVWVPRSVVAFWSRNAPSMQGVRPEKDGAGGPGAQQQFRPGG